MKGGQCISQSNMLGIVFNLASTPQETHSSVTLDSEAGLTDFTLSSTNQMNTTIQMLNFSMIDGTPTPVSFSYSEAELSILFPCYKRDFRYSMLFSMDIAPFSPSPGGGDGSSNDLLPLLALLVIPILAILALAVVLVLLLWKRRANKQTPWHYNILREETL